jgi:hypothetical protein
MREVKNDNLLWVVKYFNKWIFVLLPCEAKPWILWTLHLTKDFKSSSHPVDHRGTPGD